MSGYETTQRPDLWPPELRSGFATLPPEGQDLSFLSRLTPGRNSWRCRLETHELLARHYALREVSFTQRQQRKSTLVRRLEDGMISAGGSGGLYRRGAGDVGAFPAQAAQRQGRHPDDNVDHRIAVCRILSPSGLVLGRAGGSDRRRRSDGGQVSAPGNA